MLTQTIVNKVISILKTRGFEIFEEDEGPKEISLKFMGRKNKVIQVWINRRARLIWTDLKCPRYISYELSRISW